MRRDSTARIATTWDIAPLNSGSSRCGCGGRCGGSGVRRRRAAIRGEALGDELRLDDRGPLADPQGARAVHADDAAPGGRRRQRSTWLLTGLAFLCGGLVSAAVFSIGWRHQAQRDTAARAPTAAAPARAHRLSASLAVAQEDATKARLSAAREAASARATTQAAAALAAAATASKRSADAVSSDAGAVGATTVRVSRELQTLLTYLTTTPSGQIDSGYIASQASYLTRQLTALESAGGNVGKSVTTFQESLRKLIRDAATLNQ
jgi:hypothetical protein